MNNDWRDRAGSPFTPFKKSAAGSRGMVASNHPMASAAGAEMLAMGGNAVDAAVATAFALTVVEPMMVGIFGAGMVNYYDASSGESITIDNYAVAPAAASERMYEPVSDTWPDYLEAAGRKNRLGYLAVGVPGNLKCWCHLVESYGRLDLDTVIQPAIRYAERGFPASAYLVKIIADNREDLARFPATKEVFLPSGEPPSVGQNIVRKDYARTLRRIAENGSDELYGGELGRTVAEDMRANGGIITEDDLRSYEFKYRQPVRGSYRGRDIVAVGPTSSGGVHIVQALNILEGFDVGAMGFGAGASAHLLAEALKIAFADRFEYLGDPDFVEVPVEWITSKRYADLRRREIDLEPGGLLRSGRGDGGARGVQQHHALHRGRRRGQRRIHDADDSRGVRLEGDGARYGYAAEQQHVHFRPAPRHRELDRAGQADALQHVSHRRAGERTPAVRARDARRYPHLRVGAAGHSERARPRHEPARGGRGAPPLDARTAARSRGGCIRGHPKSPGGEGPRRERGGPRRWRHETE